MLVYLPTKEGDTVYRVFLEAFAYPSFPPHVSRFLPADSELQAAALTYTLGPRPFIQTALATTQTTPTPSWTGPTPTSGGWTAVEHWTLTADSSRRLWLVWLHTTNHTTPRKRAARKCGVPGVPVPLPSHPGDRTC